MKTLFGFKKTDFVKVILFYSLAHLGIFLSMNGYFWDDYTLIGLPDEEILQVFRENGSFMNISGWLHVYLLKLGPGIYKCLTFILYLFPGFFVNAILKKHDKRFGPDFRVYTVLLFLLFPFYLVRPALIMMPYGVSFFLFFLGWSIMHRFKVLSLFLFFLSLNIQSFLVFFLVPYLDYYYQKYGEELSFKTFFKFALRHIHFTLLPFLFFAFKLMFYKPFANYAGYNENFALINLVFGPYGMLKSFVNNYAAFLLLLFLLFIAIIVSVRKFDFSHWKVQRGNMALGLGLIVLACFPYWIIGLVPTFDEWSSRHLLLVPFGSAILIVAWISCFQEKFRPYVFSLVVACYIYLNIVNYLDFYRDWDKQKQLVALFRNDSIVKEHNLFVIKDNTKNAINRKLRYYEWNGLFNEAFNDEIRFGIASDDLLLDSVVVNLFGDKMYQGRFYTFFNLQHSKAKDFMLREKVLPATIEINYESGEITNGSVFAPLQKLTIHVSKD